MSTKNYRNITFLIILILLLGFTCFYVAFSKNDNDTPVYASFFNKNG